MSLDRFGDWERALLAFSPVRASHIIDKNFKQAMRRNAQVIRRNIVLGVRKGRAEWPPLATATILRKRSSAPLVDTGDMRNSVSVIDQGNSVFVGVPRSVKNRDGTELVRIGAVHEFGAVISKEGAERAVVIPARPWIKPGIEESRDTVAENWRRAAANSVNEMIGRPIPSRFL
jgi:phage gpG-like protein